VDTPPYFVDAGAELFAAAQEHGLEGIVCKRLTSPYTPVPRSKAWVKTVSVGQQPVSVPDFSSSRRHRTQSVVRDTCCGGFLRDLRVSGEPSPFCPSVHLGVSVDATKEVPDMLVALSSQS
jgi:hypothetical protein